MQAYLLSSRPARPYNLRAWTCLQKKGIKEKAAPKQENLDFKASLDYIAKLCPQTNKQNQNKYNPKAKISVVYGL